MPSIAVTAAETSRGRRCVSRTGWKKEGILSAIHAGQSRMMALHVLTPGRNSLGKPWNRKDSSCVRNESLASAASHVIARIAAAYNSIGSPPSSPKFGTEEIRKLPHRILVYKLVVRLRNPQHSQPHPNSHTRFKMLFSRCLTLLATSIAAANALSVRYCSNENTGTGFNTGSSST